MPSAIQTATYQAGILNVTSSILAQLLLAYRRSTLASSTSVINPLGLNFIPVLQLLFYTLISTPPNFLWQQYLENKFPGYPIQKGKQKLKIDDGGKGVTIEKKLDLRNTAIKFLLDQTLGATVNITAFLVVVKALKGGTVEECVQVVREDFWPIMITGYKIWPLVSLLSFTVVPVERRVVVGSLVGLGWGVFLALRTTA